MLNKPATQIINLINIHFSPHREFHVENIVVC